MMILQLALFLLLWQATEVPFRAKDDYEVELKYNFKEKPARDPSTVVWEAHNAAGSASGDKHGLLPYLIVNVKILNPKTEEVRFKCENNLGHSMFNKRADKDLSYDVDMGYIDDVKDRVTAHTFTVYALTDKKQALNRIELKVEEDGTFLVNGEKRGKF
jgi:hypothetical protein